MKKLLVLSLGLLTLAPVAYGMGWQWKDGIVLPFKKPLFWTPVRVATMMAGTYGYIYLFGGGFEHLYATIYAKEFACVKEKKACYKAQNDKYGSLEHMHRYHACLARAKEELHKPKV